jgi:site-specific recombinase XerD
MNDVVFAPQSALASPASVLGQVRDDWHAAEIWLREITAGSHTDSGETEAIYRQHLKKIRWYCEHVAGVPPSRWTAQTVKDFRAFLERLPPQALCASVPATSRRAKLNAVAFKREGEDGWTPFRKQPSAGSQVDILRMLKALLSAWRDAGYIPLSPMAMTKVRKPRKLNASRSISLDVYALVLDVIEREDKPTFSDRQMAARDRFIFEALRGLGLRARELVGSDMNAFIRAADPQSGRHYWIFEVTDTVAKGGVGRCIPVPRPAWEAFIVYRQAFGLDAVPGEHETTRLILSPRTNKAAATVGDQPIRRVAARRYFRAWHEVRTRQGLWAIVTSRLERAAEFLVNLGREEEAKKLQEASPHWLRHTFAKAALLQGQPMRVVAEGLGHADMATTMVYTRQEALELCAAWEAAHPGIVARADVLP